jgi:hypothetical protein
MGSGGRYNPAYPGGAVPPWVKLQPGERLLFFREVTVLGGWRIAVQGAIALTQERLLLQQQGFFRVPRPRVIPRSFLIDVRPNEPRPGRVSIRYVDGPETRTLELEPLIRSLNPRKAGRAARAAQAAELADAIRGLQRGEALSSMPPALAAAPAPVLQKKSGSVARARKPASIAALVTELIAGLAILQQGIVSARHGGSFSRMFPALLILGLIAFHLLRNFRRRKRGVAPPRQPAGAPKRS